MAVATALGLSPLTAELFDGSLSWPGAIAVQPGGGLAVVLGVKLRNSRRLVARLTTGSNAPFERHDDRATHVTHLHRRGSPGPFPIALAVAEGYLLAGSDAATLERLGPFVVARPAQAASSGPRIIVRRAGGAWSEDGGEAVLELALARLDELSDPGAAGPAAPLSLFLDRAAQAIIDAKSASLELSFEASAWRILTKLAPRAASATAEALEGLAWGRLDRLTMLPRTVRFAAGVRGHWSGGPQSSAGDGGRGGFAPQLARLFPEGLSAGLLGSPPAQAFFVVGPVDDSVAFDPGVRAFLRSADVSLRELGARVVERPRSGPHQSTVAVEIAGAPAAPMRPPHDLELAWAHRRGRGAIVAAPDGADGAVESLMTVKRTDTLGSIPLVAEADHRLGPHVGAMAIAQLGQPGAASAPVLAALGRRDGELLVDVVLSSPVVHGLLRVLMDSSATDP